MPEPAISFERFRHEGRMQPVLLGNGFEDVLEGHGAVGGGERVAVLEVDLVLADGDFVMAGFDFDVHLAEREHHLLADGAGGIGGEIEVAAAVVRERQDLAVRRLEEEELELGTGHEPVAQLFDPLQLAVRAPRADRPGTDRRSD